MSVTTLPAFTAEGVLPAGDYLLTLAQLRESFLVTGAGVDAPNWDSPWRRWLVGNLEVLAGQLWAGGVSRIFVDGSFVEQKDHPNDIDGYFECGVLDIATGRLPERLNALDPSRVWTWDGHSRQPDPNSAKRQLPMWHRYRVELYPHYPDWQMPCGILDEFGNEQTFPAAFRKTRFAQRQKGIIELIR